MQPHWLALLLQELDAAESVYCTKDAYSLKFRRVSELRCNCTDSRSSFSLPPSPCTDCSEPAMLAPFRLSTRKVSASRSQQSRRDSGRCGAIKVPDWVTQVHAPQPCQHPYRGLGRVGSAPLLISSLKLHGRGSKCAKSLRSSQRRPNQKLCSCTPLMVTAPPCLASPFTA